jgi:prolyl 4-hydroxylase
MLNMNNAASLENFVRIYDESLDASLCEEIIQKFDEHTEHHAHIAFKDVRRFTVLDIIKAPGWEHIEQNLLSSLEEYKQRYVEDTGVVWFPKEQALEHFRIKRYQPNGLDQFRIHVDVSNAVRARRFLVAFWYLNDVQEGGETTFPTLDIAVTPKQGRMLLFPPMYMYPHEAVPAISNSKYILGSYLLYL